MRERIDRFVSSKGFVGFITAIILINTVFIAIETQLAATGANENVLAIMTTIDNVCLGIYIVELALKLVAWRSSFFKDGWNVFDLVIILISVLPFFGINAAIARVFRALRALRTLRLFSIIGRMRRLVAALFKSIPAILYTLSMMVIIYFVYAIIGVDLFSEVSPDRFGGLPEAMFSLFQITTLESWPDVAMPIMNVMPAAGIYFISFIIIAAFIVLNVILGVIVDALESTDQEAVESEIKRDEEQNILITTEVASVKEQIAATNQQIAALQATLNLLVENQAAQTSQEKQAE